MKTYTDLEQSTKLSKILPPESADLTWVSNCLGKPFVRIMPIKGYPEELCPCWSLAALMEFLPNNKDITTTLGRGVYNLSNKKPEYKNKWAVEYEDEGNLDTGKYVNYTTTADTAIDACVKMILKLKRKSLL